jgi:hypothetical protein
MGRGDGWRPFIPCFLWSDGGDQQEQVFVKQFKFFFEHLILATCNGLKKKNKTRNN